MIRRMGSALWPARARLALLLALLALAAPWAGAAWGAAAGLAIEPTVEQDAAASAQAQAATAAPFDIRSLVAQLARPAPASIAFKEIRFSPLLSGPSVVSGELRYAGVEVLERHVTEPYRESTMVRGGSVRVERDGEAPRSFALKRAPELRGLLAGFSALLAGDVVALRHSFRIELEGSERAWKLLLLPLDRQARTRLQRIEVYGRHDAPRCFWTVGAGHTRNAQARVRGQEHGNTPERAAELARENDRGAALGAAPEHVRDADGSGAPAQAQASGEAGASILLLGEAAGAALPRELTKASLEALCRAE